jgi:hypothetical protein
MRLYVWSGREFLGFIDNLQNNYLSCIETLKCDKNIFSWIGVNHDSNRGGLQ